MTNRAEARAVELGSAPGTADQRREQILRAALDVMVERGFTETRIADVADRIEISPALVIYYFKTKDQLLTEAIRYSEDNWYADGQRRLATIRTAAGRLEEIVAMTCLPEADPEPFGWWLLWLDLWAQAARHPEVASVREKADERWRELIKSQVLAGQEAGQFRGVDPVSFATPVVRPAAAFEMSMRFIADQLGFDWVPSGRGSV